VTKVQFAVNPEHDEFSRKGNRVRRQHAANHSRDGTRLARQGPGNGSHDEHGEEDQLARELKYLD
jgi:hypothetical protein